MPRLSSLAWRRRLHYHTVRKGANESSRQWNVTAHPFRIGHAQGPGRGNGLSGCRCVEFVTNQYGRVEQPSIGQLQGYGSFDQQTMLVRKTANIILSSLVEQPVQRGRAFNAHSDDGHVDERFRRLLNIIERGM